MKGVSGTTYDVCAIGQVAAYDRAWSNNAVLSDFHARHYDRARSDIRSLTDYSVEVEPTRHVMGEKDRLMVDDAVRTDVDAARPCPVDIGCRRDPRRRMDFHLPYACLNKTLPALEQRKRQFG